jgi:hypothetical protein
MHARVVEADGRKLVLLSTVHAELLPLKTRHLASIIVHHDSHVLVEDCASCGDGMMRAMQRQRQELGGNMLAVLPV